MAASSVERRPSRGIWSPVSVAIYLIVIAAILFYYFQAIFKLLPFRERIMGGMQQLMPALSPLAVAAVVVALVLGVIFYKQVLKVIGRVPAGIRGIMTTIPVYLLMGKDQQLVVILVVLAAVGWLLYKPLSNLLGPQVARLPAIVGVPLARFWSAILLTALVTRSVLPTLIAALVLVLYHYADMIMEWIFRPVWVWHRRLPTSRFAGQYAGRLVIAGSAPILLSYSFAWFNPLYDQRTALYGVLVAAMGYFIGRVPTPKDLSAESVDKGPAMPAAGSKGSVALGAVIMTALLWVGWVAIALADDCSGPSDCAGTTWFANALNTIPAGLLAALGLGGLTPFLAALFPTLGLGKPPPGTVLIVPQGPLTGQDMQNRLTQLGNLANKHKDPALADLYNRYKDRLVGPDGKPRPQEWQKLRDEFQKITQGRVDAGEKPNSWIWDVAATPFRAVGEFGGMVGDVLVGFGSGVVTVVGTVVVGIGNAVLHPIDTATGVAQGLGNIMVNTARWLDTVPGMRETAQDFRDALKEGRYGDALADWAKVTSTILWEGGKAIGHEMLPIDEIKSFFDPHADLETRLWAIPAAASKIAGILIAFEKLATTPIPGLGPTTTLIPSVKAEAQMAVKLAEFASQGGKLGEAAQAVQKVQGMAGEAFAGQNVKNMKDLQAIIRENPALANALDDAIKAGSGAELLPGFARGGAMSKETEMLITARKMQAQEQAMANATRRILQEEAQAAFEATGTKGGSYQTFNASQGSRSTIGGANTKVDLDQTITGLQHVSEARVNEILAEEAKNLGFKFDPKLKINELETNIYKPPPGKLIDPAGDKPLSEGTLKQIIQQNTSSSGRYHTFVDSAGNVHVTGPFTGQGSQVLGIGEQIGGVQRWTPQAAQAAAEAATTPAEREAFTKLASELSQDMKTLSQGVDKYYAKHDYAALVKTANREAQIFGKYDPETQQLLKQLAGQKLDTQLTPLLNSKGMTWQDLMARLGHAR
ncbi:MAG: hypothetical protein Q8R28_14700 [Dehalococcoidia bacterium]|nr:hypothetical protein [Dehalococcoidia bacterium]